MAEKTNKTENAVNLVLSTLLDIGCPMKRDSLIRYISEIKNQPTTAVESTIDMGLELAMKSGYIEMIDQQYCIAAPKFKPRDTMVDGAESESDDSLWSFDSTKSTEAVQQPPAEPIEQTTQASKVDINRGDAGAPKPDPNA